ncbi:hypothetical protein BH20CHL6_BH20CHL6_00450 [soil metagenome]
MRMPGTGIAKGMLLTLRNMFRRKPTIQYPEVVQDISPKHRGRLLLLYDEYGNLKCETCFQCAAACPIEIIDMGGVDTKNRYHVHWGPAEQYAERRTESALRRSGRVVPDAAFGAWSALDLTPVEQILADVDYDPGKMLTILERTQEVYGHLPVAAMQHISHSTGAWYSEMYGIASSYEQLRLDPAPQHEIGLCRCPKCTMLGGGRLRNALEQALDTEFGSTSPDGAVRLVPVECHGDSGGQPLLVVDGEPQPEASAALVTALAERMRGEPVQGARI